nr:unnamed protein product [Callosobruchus analis]
MISQPDLTYHDAYGKSLTEFEQITAFLGTHYINGIKFRTHCVTAEGKTRPFSILWGTARPRPTMV